MGHRQREGARELQDRLHEAVLAVLLDEDVLLGGEEQRQSLLGSSRLPAGPVEAVEEVAADLVLLLHDRHRFALVDGVPPGAAALGVRRKGLLQLVRESQVVHH